ncbi:hypothetical protein [Saccharicrinis sp. FJH54]|uniref:hypothetical protein n=1 Tax=Saccharicrinis sp. FJH54 TaxID=3344665 RepID=UPI0035D4047A
MTKILTISILGLVSCIAISKTDKFIGGWTENRIEFINSIPHVDQKDGYRDLMMYFKWAGINKGDLFQTNDSPFDWIRKPDNLISAHNTLKAIGYEKILSKESYQDTMYFQDRFGGMLRHDWEGLTIEQIIDGLISFYYQAIRIDTGYYHDFWKRRINEGNASEVLTVLEDIRDIYSDSNNSVDFQMDLVNDTIKSLLQLDLELQSYDTIPSKEFMTRYFDYLVKIGLNHSAYNWMIEQYPNQFDKDSINRILKLDTIPESKYWQTRNNGTWIYTYRDNGP